MGLGSKDLLVGVGEKSEKVGMNQIPSFYYRISKLQALLWCNGYGDHPPGDVPKFINRLVTSDF